MITAEIIAYDLHEELKELQELLFLRSNPFSEPLRPVEREIVILEEITPNKIDVF